MLWLITLFSSRGSSPPERPTVEMVFHVAGRLSRGELARRPALRRMLDHVRRELGHHQIELGDVRLHRGSGPPHPDADGGPCTVEIYVWDRLGPEREDGGHVAGMSTGAVIHLSGLPVVRRRMGYHLVHELGHHWGLPHHPSPNNAMFAISAKGTALDRSQRRALWQRLAPCARPP